LWFLGIVVRGELAKRRQPEAKALLGKTISLPGVQFPKDHNSLVIAVSTGCHFCKDSLPFYKELSVESQGKVGLVAVLPQPQSEARAFLDQAGIATSQVVSANLDTIGVRGTPTVLLVDGNGKVKAAWVGLLDEKGQQEILSLALPKISS
jgi:hypothetical protein